MRRVSLFLLCLLVIPAGCGDAADQDAAPPTSDSIDLPAAEEAPDDLAALESAYVDTPLQNEYVDVHRVALPAGASIEPHEGGPRVVYSLGSYTLRFERDGAAETQSFEAGDVHYHDGGVHAVENTGSEEASFIVFERSDTALPTTQAQDDTPVPTPGEGATDEVIFDNAFAEVHRVTLQPGAQLPPHRGYARALYSLSGYTVTFTGEDGTRQQSFEEGEAHYHDPGDHTVENAGDTVAEFLVVEFKP